jgi:hypothetical protein
MVGFVDKSSWVRAGSTPLLPSSRQDFRVFHGEASSAQVALRNLGRRVDQSRAEIHGPERVMARYEPHNCFPWRSTFCVSQSSQGRAYTSTTQPLAPQWEPHAPSTSTHGIPTPTTSRDAQWQSQPGTSRPWAVGEMLEQTCGRLFRYFFEDGGENDSVGQRREKSASILREELRRPIMLSRSHENINGCDEFSTIKAAVESSLEAMCVDGLTLVPELYEDGRQLLIYVICSME